MAYFYLDFRDANKQGFCDLVLSLLTQLSARSGPCRDILTNLQLHDRTPLLNVLYSTVL